eukprot:Gb_14787 [translate_table: standard]
MCLEVRHLFPVRAGPGCQFPSVNSNMVSEPCKTCDFGLVCGQFSSLDLVCFGFLVFKSASCIFQGGYGLQVYLCVVKIPVHLMLFLAGIYDRVKSVTEVLDYLVLLYEIFEGEEQWLTLVESEVFEGILRVEDTWASSLNLWNIEEAGDGVRTSVVVFKIPCGLWNDCGDLCGGADFIMFGRDVFGDHPLNKTTSIQFVAWKTYHGDQTVLGNDPRDRGAKLKNPQALASEVQRSVVDPIIEQIRSRIGIEQR